MKSKTGCGNGLGQPGIEANICECIAQYKHFIPTLLKVVCSLVADSPSTSMGSSLCGLVGDSQETGRTETNPSNSGWRREGRLEAGVQNYWQWYNHLSWSEKVGSSILSALYWSRGSNNLFDWDSTITLTGHFCHCML